MDLRRASIRRETDTGQLIAVDFASLAVMNAPIPGNRYGSPNIAMKILWSLVALAMIVLGAIWALAASGGPQSFGPVVAGLGVALGYVVLIQKRH